MHNKHGKVCKPKIPACTERDQNKLYAPLQVQCQNAQAWVTKVSAFQDAFQDRVRNADMRFLLHILMIMRRSRLRFLIQCSLGVQHLSCHGCQESSSQHASNCKLGELTQQGSLHQKMQVMCIQHHTFSSYPPRLKFQPHSLRIGAVRKDSNSNSPHKLQIRVEKRIDSPKIYHTASQTGAVQEMTHRGIGVAAQRNAGRSMVQRESEVVLQLQWFQSQGNTVLTAAVGVFANGHPAII